MRHTLYAKIGAQASSVSRRPSFRHRISEAMGQFKAGGVNEDTYMLVYLVMELFRSLSPEEKVDVWVEP